MDFLYYWSFGDWIERYPTQLCNRAGAITTSVGFLQLMFIISISPWFRGLVLISPELATAAGEAARV